MEIGDKAPPFALKNQDDETVKLGDHKGRWLVLYFYPRDDTPGCTVEACEFTAALERFEGLAATVLGCSPDTPERHRKFIAKYELAHHLLSDPDHDVMLAYGAWGQKNMYGRITEGVIRSTVIIDPQARIAARWSKVTTKGHAEAVRAKLAALQGAPDAAKANANPRAKKKA
jgi:thioredoxin-dependent peroxiredoxin